MYQLLGLLTTLSVNFMSINLLKMYNTNFFDMISTFFLPVLW